MAGLPPANNVSILQDEDNLGCNYVLAAHEASSVKTMVASGAA
ncbi:hypothetical protein DB30_03572 [Enhygromyxa salina]|uniref:Uncharacterized protein n=1 Tax=Enhygromyxa salina TaxID=215803 RepID=A0A0C2CUE0_9BACT|nr:hypothetical protein DB30_03572 [Enhygromyxa salina]